MLQCNSGEFGCKCISQFIHKITRLIVKIHIFINCWTPFRYMIVLKFPWNIITWVTTLLFSASLSIAIGAIYWNMRLSISQDQNNLNDRLGFHWVMLCLGLWPVVLIILHNDRKEIRYVARDISEGLYSRAMFIVAKVCGLRTSKQNYKPFYSHFHKAYIIIA